MTPRVELTLFEAVLLAGTVAAPLAYVESESAFTVTIIWVAVLALVALFHDAVR